MMLIIFLNAISMGMAFDFEVPSAQDIVTFGSLLCNEESGSQVAQSKQSIHEKTPRSDMLLEIPENRIACPASGSIFFAQIDSSFPSVFSFPLGGACAIVHPDNYISMIAGIDSEQLQTMTAATAENKGSPKNSTKNKSLNEIKVQKLI